MLFALAKGALGAALLLCGWVAVETAWRRVFARDFAEGERPACGGCLVCSRRCASREGDSDLNASAGRVRSLSRPARGEKAPCN